VTDQLRIKLDRTLCDGFGICAKHAPEYFSLDDWGYAVLVGDGTIPDRDHNVVRRALSLSRFELQNFRAHAVNALDQMPCKVRSTTRHCCRCNSSCASPSRVMR